MRAILLLSFLFLFCVQPSLAASTAADDGACALVQKVWDEFKVDVDEWTAHPENFLPPVPPVFKYECYGEPSMIVRDNRQKREALEFADQYFRKEKEIATKINAYDEFFLGCNVDKPAIIERYKTSSMELLKTRTLLHLNQIRNFPAPEKFDYYFAAISGSLSAEKAIVFLGGEFPELATQRNAMMRELIKYLQDEVVLRHNFMITPEAFKTALLRAGFTGVFSPGYALELFEEALGFYRLDVDYENINQLNPPNDPDLHMKWVNTSKKTYDLTLVSTPTDEWIKVKVRYRPQEIPLSLVATGKVEDGTLTYKGDTAFMSDFNIETFACDADPKAYLSVSRFGPDKEAWTLCDEGICMPMPWASSSHTIGLTVMRDHNFIVQAPWPEAIYSPMSPPLAFTFMPDFRNKNVVFVDHSVTGQVAGDEVFFFSSAKWKVTHNPKLQ